MDLMLLPEIPRSSREGGELRTSGKNVNCFSYVTSRLASCFNLHLNQTFSNDAACCRKSSHLYFTCFERHILLESLSDFSDILAAASTFARGDVACQQMIE